MRQDLAFRIVSLGAHVTLATASPSASRETLVIFVIVRRVLTADIVGNSAEELGIEEPIQ